MRNEINKKEKISDIKFHQRNNKISDTFQSCIARSLQKFQSRVRKQNTISILKVLADRNLSFGRIVGVMLMSDGQQNRGGNAVDVKIGNAPVYTFGFGADYNPTVLNAVARNNMGGTFSVVNDVDKLSMAFS